jgi:hypothetical protein
MQMYFVATLSSAIALEHYVHLGPWQILFRPADLEVSLGLAFHMAQLALCTPCRKE